MRAGIAGELAKKEDEGRRRLYKRREEMVGEIFEKAEGKLLDYTKTAEYTAALKEDAKEAADFFGGDTVTVYVKSDDMAISGELSAIFGNNCSVKAASDIIIGGFKAQCASKGVVVDFTLDTKLENQKDWFLQNSKLKI